MPKIQAVACGQGLATHFSCTLTSFHLAGRAGDGHVHHLQAADQDDQSKHPGERNKQDLKTS